MINRLTAEQHFLLGEARYVWKERDDAKLAGLPWQEETITDIFLKRLKLNYPGSVDVISFNKQLEGESGADWLWSFLKSDGSSSTTMLVQAKRLSDDEIEYPQIQRKIGRRLPPARQIDELIKTAAQCNVPALYAFYNHLSNQSRIPRTCASLAPTDPDHVLGFGISLADAFDVLAQLPNAKFDTLAPHSFPLHCLLCTQGLGKKASGGSPDTVVRTLYSRLRARREAAKAGLPFDPYAVGFSQGLHPVVERAIKLRSELTQASTSHEFDLPNISGVVLLRDAEELPAENGSRPVD